MGRAYPSRPIVGVGAVVIRGDEVLLVRRGREPQKGLWSIPGGALELGESLADGARRETREESGLEIRPLDVIEVFERVIRDPDGRVRYHYVLIDYLCEAVGGRLLAGDDAAECRWVARDQVAEYSTTAGAPAVIEKAFQRLADNHDPRS